MTRKLLTSFILMLPFFVFAQHGAPEDSLKIKLSKAKTSEEKVDILADLSRILMNTNIAEADQYGKMMNEEAEISRNRNLIAKALLINGQRYSFFGGKRDYLQKSIDYYNQALSTSKENKLDKETTEALLGLSSVYLLMPDPDKSLNYTTEAFSIASTINDDSLKVAAYNSYGNVYQLKKARLQALRNYLNALRIAEELKQHDLLRSCYTNLRQFYADIKEYDKGIDYAQKAMDQLAFLHSGGEMYNKVVDLYFIGNLYVVKKDFDMSVFYFEKSIRLADSLKYEPLKMPAYNGLLNQYMRAKQPQKALEYFNKSPELKKFITNFGMAYVIDQAYGEIYTELGKYDSAKIYLEKAAPVFETASTPSSKLAFYFQYADFFNLSGNPSKAIEYYNKAKLIADQTSSIDWQEAIAKELDSIYAKTGDYKQSYYYSGLYHQYKDSIQKMGEEKDIMSMELKDEEQRQTRVKAEEEAALDRKHYVQYMGITIGIAIVFLLLVVMGAFKVSETTITTMGFFAFILLFEFIILLADTKIHHWTDGDPLKILGIKIILIAMLLPLHHWLEHKVVSYLASKRMIIPSGKSIWNSLVTKKSKKGSDV